MQTISQLYYNINQIKYIIEKKKKKIIIKFTNR
jgi:hypothetical protein